MTSLISFRLPDGLLNAMDDIVAENSDYPSRAEFIRESIRENLLRVKNDEQI